MPLQITIKFNPKKRFPVYKKDIHDFEAKSAFIMVNVETGVCTAGYSDSGDVESLRKNDTILIFQIHPESTADNIKQLMQANTEKFERIINRMSVQMNDINQKAGFFEGDAYIEYQLSCKNFGFLFEHKGGLIDEDYFHEWVKDKLYPVDEMQSITQYAESLLMLDGQNEYYFADEIKSTEKIKALLLESWHENLILEQDVPVHVAKMFINAGGQGLAQDLAFEITQ